MDADDLFTAPAACRGGTGALAPREVEPVPTENDDGLAFFRSDQDDWSSTAESAPSHALLELVNDLDLFPPESDISTLTAADSNRRIADALNVSTGIPTEFNSQDDDDVGNRAAIAAYSALGPAQRRWAAGPLATATFVLLTGVLSDRVDHQPSTFTRAMSTDTMTSAQRVEPDILTPRSEPTQTYAAPLTERRPSLPATVAMTGVRFVPLNRDSAIEPRTPVLSLKPTVEEPPTLAAAATPLPVRATAVEPGPLSSSLVVPLTSLAPSAETSTIGMADTDTVQAVLERYQKAFNDLDAGEAKTIWPSVDERALGRAFGQLESQQVILDGCEVKVIGQRAAASCGGRASYVPRVGNKTARVEARRWVFTLRKTGYSWIIETIELSASR